jgi:hypothetical protein
MIQPRVSRLLLIALPLAFALSAHAGMQHRIEGKAFSVLERPLAASAKVNLERIPLADGELAKIELARFDILAPEAQVVVHDGDGKGRKVKPVPMKHFRGSIAGDKNSLVYLSTREDNIEGFVFTSDRKFMLASRKPTRGAEGRALERDVLVDEVPPQFEYATGEGYKCDFEDELVVPSRAMVPQSLSFEPRVEAALTGTQQTVLNLAISSDSALYMNFGQNATTVETYLRNLLAATATIYKRDLDTDLRITYLGVHTTSDPWTVNPGGVGNWDGGQVQFSTLHALLEFGDYWHNTPPAALNTRSAAMLISGQSQSAGIAWTDNVCSTEFYASSYSPNQAYPHYGGPYAYCGGIGTNPTVPDPDALPNYGVPGSNYWPLLQTAHELGHTVRAPHTHCITVDPNVYGRSYVDHCVNASGCYGGSTSVPAEKGTIMSYCHLWGGASSRFTFGQAGEASEQVINLMRTRLDQKTPILSTITAPASIAPGATGVVSVTNTGLTYQWSITNGTFTGGGTTATGASVSFTGTTSPVTLTVIATNSVACSITDSIIVPVIAGQQLAAPTGVTATAASPTSVNVAWNAVASATGYQIFRSASGTNGFTQIGTSATNAYLDSSASANTAYLYRVRATNASSTSPDSGYDLATTVIFTDPALTSTASVKAAHVTQLRTAVNAVRILAGFGAGSYTDAGLTTGTTVRRLHILDLRSNLDGARGLLSLQALTYTDSSITAGATRPKAAHIAEIRAGTQ